MRPNLEGKGLATHLLLHHNPPGVDPLSPENNLVFVNGATAGTPVWGSSRYGVYTKSPQTGYYSESYAGGKVADRISSTGFDAIIFHGAADQPVWIEVFEDSVIFHSAENLWGKSTYETEDYVKNWIKENRAGNGKCGVVCIGPAGESLVTFAVIENDYWRSAGRTGVGTVMGSKIIKAIAFRGERKKEIANPEMVQEFNRGMGKRSKDDAGVKAYKGMDTISAGNLTALAIEASRQGIIDHKIDYGNTDQIARLLEDISARRGIGDLLAQGIKAVAHKWGMEDQAIHVKGLEPAGYDPRVLKGMGLAYGSSARGACHLRATFYKPELSGIVDPEEIEGKAATFVQWEDRLTIFDTFILCRFFRDLYQWSELASILEAVTGLVLTEHEMREVARNVTDDTRRFNLQEGLTLEEDHLPSRFYKEMLPETSRGITSQQMNQLLAEYYKARGWDEQGRVTTKD